VVGNRLLRERGDKLLTKSGNGGIGKDKRKTGQDEDGGGERSLWEKVALSLVDPNSNKWFEELGTRPASEVFSMQIEVQGDSLLLNTPLLSDDDFCIAERMQMQHEEFGQPQAIDTTRLGAGVIKYLEANGVSYNFKTAWPISHFEQIELDQKLRIEGQWGTESGQPFMQNFEVYKDASGNETAFWFVHLLASPLAVSSHNSATAWEDGEAFFVSMPDHMLDKGGLTFGEISTKIHLPIFLKRLAYLCETPFPSTQIMSMSRDIAFSKIPLSARPIPTFVVQEQEFAMGYSSLLSKKPGKSTYNGTIFPEVVSFGWRFGEDSLEYLDDFMATVVDGCTYAVSTVEDGYRNFRRDDYPYEWDSALRNPCVFNANYEPGGSRLGWPQWIPVSELGDIVTSSELTLQEAQASITTEDQRVGFWKLLEDGAGRFMASAGNSLLYDFLIPELQEDTEGLGEIEWVAETIIGLDVLGESDNARCNLGLAYAIAGMKDRAHEALDPVLESAQPNSVAEAYFYLSYLYGKLGDKAKSETYTKLSADSGKYQPPGWLEPQGLLDIEVSAISKASFCGECGSKFANNNQKFCVDCGSARG